MITTPGVDFTDLSSWPDIGDRSWSGFQRKRFFHNRGDGTFSEMGAAAGLDNDRDGRGIGVFDIENDGHLDLVQTNANQAPILYHNISQNVGNWIELRLIGTKSNRDAIGARVQLDAGGLRQIRELDGGNGFASESTRRVHFGIGSASRIDHLQIRWPSGHIDQLDVPINRLSYVEEARGLVR